MAALVFIGFAALLVAALYLSVAAFGGMIATYGFTGKIDAVCYLFAFLAVAAWVVVYLTWPFEIIVKGGAA